MGSLHSNAPLTGLPTPTNTTTTNSSSGVGVVVVVFVSCVGSTSQLVQSVCSVCRNMKLWTLILPLLGVQGGPMPAFDRPQKQADYAALSHPANLPTVMAKTTVGQVKPLQPSYSGQAQAYRYY